jgi:outer membrane protein assembly factor BamB
MLTFLLRALAVICLLAASSAAHAAARTALVIGNSAYPFGPLVNPANDAKLIAETLKKTGFDVPVVLDANRVTMQSALIDFSRDIRSKDTVGLFYYAGHGAQVNGANYLVPVDADIKSEAEVKIFAINVDEFISTLERADGRTNIVILDSCRNNPFGSGTRSINRGMALPDAPAGTFVALSTSPGAVALDGEGANSPYAEALAKSMLEPNVSIEQAFKVTRRLVLETTKQKQVPWETSSLTGDFFFLQKSEEPALAPVAAAPEVKKVAEPEVALVDPAPAVEPEAAPSPVVEPAPATDGSYVTLDIQPQIFPVGKWPEGLTIADNAIWVVESGSRQIVKIDPGAGDLLQAVKVGRLPVPMVSDPDGNVYTATYTDQQVYKQPPGGAKGKAIASFKGKSIIEGLAYGEGAVYVATKTLANEASIIRIDPKTGKTKSSPVFAASPTGILNGLQMVQDRLWMLYGGAQTTLTVFDMETLQPAQTTGLDGFVWSIAGNLDAVYAGGREDQTGGKSIIHRIARGNPEDKHMQVLDGNELILAVTANNDRVAALGAAGTVWILDAASLRPLKKFNTGREPRAAVFENGNLFITAHQGSGENGVVMIYSNVGNLD